MRCALVLNSLLSLMNLWNQHLKAKKKIIFCLRSVFLGLEEAGLAICSAAKEHR